MRDVSRIRLISPSFCMTACSDLTRNSRWGTVPAVRALHSTTASRLFLTIHAKHRVDSPKQIHMHTIHTDLCIFGRLQTSNWQIFLYPINALYSGLKKRKTYFCKFSYITRHGNTDARVDNSRHTFQKHVGVSVTKPHQSLHQGLISTERAGLSL